MTRPLLISAILLAVLNQACTKTGPMGVMGAMGAMGADGNANVTFDSLIVTGTQWTSTNVEYQDSLGTNFFPAIGFDVKFPAITQGIVDSGMVAVYFTPRTGTSELEPLPFQSIYYNDNLLFYDYKVDPGIVHLVIYFTPLGSYIYDIDKYYPGTHTFKIVATAGHL